MSEITKSDNMAMPAEESETISQQLSLARLSGKFEPWMQQTTQADRDRHAVFLAYHHVLTGDISVHLLSFLGATPGSIAKQFKKELQTFVNNHYKKVEHLLHPEHPILRKQIRVLLRQMLLEGWFKADSPARLAFGGSPMSIPSIEGAQPPMGVQSSLTLTALSRHLSSSTSVSMLEKDGFNHGIDGMLADERGSMQPSSLPRPAVEKAEEKDQAPASPNPPFPSARRFKQGHDDDKVIEDSIKKVILVYSTANVKYPVSLPFTLQHKLLVKIQLILEEVLFRFSRKWAPSILEMNRWYTSEQLELNVWWRKFQNYLVPSSALAAGPPLSELFRRVPQIRHCAVHRQQNIPIGIIEAMIHDALSLTTVLRDEECSAYFANLHAKLVKLYPSVEANQLLKLKNTETQLALISLETQQIQRKLMELEEQRKELNQTERKLAESKTKMSNDMNIIQPMQYISPEAEALTAYLEAPLSATPLGHNNPGVSSQDNAITMSLRNHASSIQGASISNVNIIEPTCVTTNTQNLPTSIGKQEPVRNRRPRAPKRQKSEEIGPMISLLLIGDDQTSLQASNKRRKTTDFAPEVIDLTGDD